jgi:predicted N-acyltransferase
VTNFEVQVADNLDQIDASAWDRLNADESFSSEHWLRLSTAILPALRPCFICLYSHDQLVGAAITTFTTQPGVQISSALGQRIIKTLLGRCPLLVCQVPFAWMTGLRLPQGDEIAALRAINRHLREIAAERNVSFTALGWLTAELYDLVRRAGGYQFVRLDDSTTLRVTWPTFYDYVASLGKSMRKDWHRHTNRARDLNIVVERVQHFAQYRDQLRELVFNVENTYGSTNVNTYSPYAFDIAERDLSDRGVMLLARADEKLIGCGLLIRDKGVMRLALLGMDYRFKYTYFQLFYEAIRYAIEHGIHTVKGGSGAYDFKTRLGFRREPAYIAFDSHRSALRWMGAKMAHMISAEGNASSPPETS